MIIFVYIFCTSSILLFLVGDEIRRILLESLLPFLMELLLTKKMEHGKGGERRSGRGQKQGHGGGGSSPPVDLILADYEEFDDYLEMVIQFGVRVIEVEEEEEKEEEEEEVEEEVEIAKDEVEEEK